MKKIIIASLALSCFAVNAQDNKAQPTTAITDSSKNATHQKKISHEIGVNATYLIKQLFSSSTSLSIQPYQLTYKLIKNRWAIRSGIGADWANSNTDEFEISSSNYYAPNNYVPTFSKSFNIYGRLGCEYRFRISRKLLCYAGIDALTQFSKSNSQTSNLSNNLPNSYFYELQTSKSRSSTFGIGPVLGIQFYATRRFSIYAELPIYFLQSWQNNQLYEYSNVLNSGGSTFNSSYTDDHKTIKKQSLNISLPATLYFAVKF